ncbi:hypothetical protein RB653_004839 [Dictyostelium firmibasis]|uniref:Uncharacterized protein n=1 Tax=Dictyostelium firmibasis TaxID=79012 RepID=A0AAN7UK21_9MYCE
MIKQLTKLNVVKQLTNNIGKRQYCTYFENRNNNLPYNTEPVQKPEESPNTAQRYFDIYNKHKTFVSFFDKNSITTPSITGLYPRNGAEFVAPSASIIGNVNLGAGSSVWDNCVIRADVNYIHIGAFSNVQDGTIIREASEPLSLDHNGSTIIGEDVTIGHNCILEACTVEESCLIGMGSILESESYVEANSILGSNSILTSGTRIKSGELWLGKPAKFVRHLTEDEIIDLSNGAHAYYLNAQKAQKSFGLDEESFIYADAEQQGIQVGWKGEYYADK